MPLQGLNPDAILSYMDDVCAHSTRLDDLIQLTSELLERLLDFGLKINPAKTTLFTRRVKLLGFIVSKEGISLPNDYIK